MLKHESERKDLLKKYSDEEIAAVCRKIIAGLVQEWTLTESELRTLLGPGCSPNELNTGAVKLSDNAIERIGLLVGIHAASYSLLPDRKRAASYLRKANSELDGDSALSIMLRGSIDDLETVWRYLESRLV